MKSPKPPKPDYSLAKYGEQVREHRKKRGLSQTKLGRMVGCGVAQINNIEHGRNWSHQTLYRKLCIALGVGVPPLMK